MSTCNLGKGRIHSLCFVEGSIILLSEGNMELCLGSYFGVWIEGEAHSRWAEVSTELLSNMQLHQIKQNANECTLVFV